MRKPITGPCCAFPLLARVLCCFIVAFTLCAPAPAQESSLASTSGALDPLPPDTGAAGLRQMLRRLGTTARLIQTTAHPDDEDGGMLTLESRGQGVTSLLFTVTHGEGGQNKIGSNLSDALGVLRTLELTASDRYYGVEQRFSRAADFGFSKTADETFQKWHGHDIALSDMVRVIRTFRPDVLIARFSGTERDGHGNHQASAILTREAFRAAADPNRFPDQIKEGLRPWQAKKLYIGNVCGFGAQSCPAENYTVKLNTGEPNPDLGMSYLQFAVEGLRHQLSQGAGAWTADPGPHYAFYKLVDSVLPASKAEHEENFFDGMDVTLPGLASRLGADQAKVPFLRPELNAVAEDIRQAAAQGEKAPAGAAGPLLSALHGLDRIVDRLQKSSLPEPAKSELLQILGEKRAQAEAAINLALNVSLEAGVFSADEDATKLPPEAQALVPVSPGQTFAVLVKLHNGSSHTLRMEDISLEGFEGWIAHASKGPLVGLQPGQDYSARFALKVPANAPVTRPLLHRADPARDTVYSSDDPRTETLPFPPARFRALVRYSVVNSDSPAPAGNNNSVRSAKITAPVLVSFLDNQGAKRKRALTVAPAFSVALEPDELVIPRRSSSASVTVAIACNRSGEAAGTLRLEVPAGWRFEPASRAVEIHTRGEKQQFEFKLFPAPADEPRVRIRAVLDVHGKPYSEAYSVVARDDLDSFYYYQPAVQRVSVVEVKVPPQLKVGYVMGAGDDIPPVLKQIGMDLALIPAENLATADLKQYGTIVLGIRAYDTQKDVIANNKRLLDFVSAGGTLVVQYNAGVPDFNRGNFTPYPAQLGRTRVSVEEAPVEVLAPDDGVFHFPNEISPQDFSGWVQERGLNFMDQWDNHFKPLLACHDPGEPPQQGGLLRAQYGKGTYIYVGYAFFRQLPAAVPGAIRLYVNLLSAGHEKDLQPYDASNRSQTVFVQSPPHAD